MDLSYWEYKSWFSEVDFTVVGSGVVGLSTALNLKERFPNKKIMILEKGMLPQGASTKNAGFACFGSLSEIIDDLRKHTEQEVFDLVKKRWEGLQLLRQTLGDTQIDFQQNGGYEVFRRSDNDVYDECVFKREPINELLAPIFKKEVFSLCENKFNFEKVPKQYVFNQFEGQIDTGKMMTSLMQQALKKGVKILNNISVKSFSDDGSKVKIETDQIEFSTNKLLIATNGFAKQLLNEDIQPARAQVLITKPISNLHIKGTFHLDKGYYYFRNIDDRLLFGGGRNLDFKGEETVEFGTTEMIQKSLEDLLKDIILPNTPFEIDHRWSGIMGVGKQKKAIVKQLSNRVYCGVRLGGMGVAIGSLIGKELAELI